MLKPPMENGGPHLPTRDLLDSRETKEEKREGEATFTETSSTARQHTRDPDTCAHVRLEWPSAFPRRGKWGRDAMTCPRPLRPSLDWTPAV